MKLLVNELSKLTNTNIETIRKYRNLGLLNPTTNEENGYYIYHDGDIYSLFMIKRNRAMGIGLDDIKQSLMGDHTNISIMEREIQQKKAQIEILKQQLEHLEHAYANVISSTHFKHQVQIIHSENDKYEFPIMETYNECPDCYKKWLQDMGIVTLSIHIELSDLLNAKPEQQLNYTICIGSYRHLIEAYHLPIPENSYYIPDSDCLSIVVRLKANERLTYHQIKPILDYANEHHYTLTSALTGYVLSTQIEENELYIYYRLRINFSNSSVQ